MTRIIHEKRPTGLTWIKPVGRLSPNVTGP